MFWQFMICIKPLQNADCRKNRKQEQSATEQTYEFEDLIIERVQ
jgi:hypothetical protein